MIDSGRKAAVKREKERLAIWKTLRTRKIGMRPDQIQIPLEKQHGLKMEVGKINRICAEMSTDPQDGRVQRNALRNDRWVAISDFHNDPDQLGLI